MIPFSCKDEWSAPLDKDALRPAPLGGQCFTKFDAHRALLFGGRYEGRGRVNDTWIFDLEQRVYLLVHDLIHSDYQYCLLCFRNLLDP